MDIILPCAGQSTRFANMRPKYLLSDYTGQLMIEHVIEPYVGTYPIHMIILQEHDHQYHVKTIVNNLFGNKVNVIVLPTKTRGPADTVFQGLNVIGLDKSAPILIRDCDSFFDHQPLTVGNQLFTAKLDDYPNIRNTAGKSYVIVNYQNIVDTIVEKNIVSNRFCVGGYQFARCEHFLAAYQSLATNQLEPYVSGCVDYLVSQGEVFTCNEVANWLDVGTSQDWLDFNNRPTIFCDIDGTMIKNQDPWGTNNYASPSVPLTDNINALHVAKKRGCQIIFTTARAERYRTETRAMLDSYGFESCQLLMGLHHSRRIIINDFAPSNPYPSAVAINIHRDSDSLAAILQSYLGT